MSHHLNRRELLASCLGVPFAFSGCGRADSPPLPPGELVGASASVGHRLREHRNFEVPADNWQRTKVVIVGGGVAGLSAARKLKQNGIDDFLVLELEQKAGGTSQSGRSNAFQYPWGAHYVPAPTKDNLALVELLAELDLIEEYDENGEPVYAEQHLCWDPQERVFYKGTWYEGQYLKVGASDEDERQRLAFLEEVNRWVAFRDGQGRRAFALPIASGSDDPEVTALDRITMAEWLDERGFTSPRLRWVLNYSCRDDYGLTIEQASAWAGIFYFAARMREPGDDTQPFLTWPEGNARLVRHLASYSKSQLQTGQMVIEIAPGEQSGQPARILSQSYDGKRVQGIEADHVIFAAPQFLAPYLIRTWRRNPPAHVAEFTYSPWAVANLILKDRPTSRGFPLAWDNVLHDSKSLGYIAATHQTGRDHGPTVFTWYYPLCEEDVTSEREKLLSMNRDDWATVALADLQRAHPDIHDLTEQLHVMRWGHAMIRPTPGFVWGTARKAATEPHHNIHFAHSDLSGIALFEEAFSQGNRAAEEVLQEFPS